MATKPKAQTDKAQGGGVAEKNQGGRPTAYKPEYAEQARKYCLLGADDAKLAMLFDVTETTINNWKQSHHEFFESIKRGKEIADAEVADRLYQRAMGYEHPEVDIRVVGGEIVQTPIRKVYAPDPTSAIFWLKNRQRAAWREKIDHEVTGKDGGPIETKEVSELEAARRIAFALTLGLKAAGEKESSSDKSVATTK